MIKHFLSCCCYLNSREKKLLDLLLMLGRENDTKTNTGKLRNCYAYETNTEPRNKM